MTGDAKIGVYSNPAASKLARKAFKWEMLLRGKRRVSKSSKMKRNKSTKKSKTMPL